MTLQTGDSAAASPIRMGQPGATQIEHNRFGLTGVSKSFDRRIVAIRPDLADIAVAGQHFAPHYAAPMTLSGVLPHAAMRSAPQLDAPQISELLYGEAFALLDVTGGWAWGYSYADHRVGFLAIDALGLSITPTHRIIGHEIAIRSEANADSGGSAILPYGAQLMGEVQGEWLSTTAGFVPLSAVAAIGTLADAATVAESFLGAPYLAGGRTAKGVDAAGLVQIAAAAAGIRLPRDADLQAAALAPHASTAQRGAVVFIGDHVGVMVDGETILHACPLQGQVAAEPLRTVVARAAEAGGSAQPIFTSLSSASKELR